MMTDSIRKAREAVEEAAHDYANAAFKVDSGTADDPGDDQEAFEKFAAALTAFGEAVLNAAQEEVNIVLEDAGFGITLEGIRAVIQEGGSP